MAGFNFNGRGQDLGTFGLPVAAPGMKRAPRRRIDRRGDIAGKGNPRLFFSGIRRRNRRYQGLAVGMPGGLKEHPSGGRFHQPPEVHHNHPVRDMPDHGKIVGNKQIGQAETFLQRNPEIEYLRLDGDIQRREADRRR